MQDGSIMAKRKKIFRKHWLSVGIAGVVIHEKKSHTHLVMQETEDGNLRDMRIYE